MANMDSDDAATAETTRLCSTVNEGKHSFVPVIQGAVEKHLAGPPKASRFQGRGQTKNAAAVGTTPTEIGRGVGCFESRMADKDGAPGMLTPGIADWFYGCAMSPL